jgi:hypothetical protein
MGAARPFRQAGEMSCPQDSRGHRRGFARKCGDPTGGLAAPAPAGSLVAPEVVPSELVDLLLGLPGHAPGLVTQQLRVRLRSVLPEGGIVQPHAGEAVIHVESSQLLGREILEPTPVLLEQQPEEAGILLRLVDGSGSCQSQLTDRPAYGSGPAEPQRVEVVDGYLVDPPQKVVHVVEHV